ncbi:MAG: carbonate dehydratase [Chitinophagaceae bacterium]|nr:carbonate dehydratase [Chitinophagaceae bacterium]
MNPIYKKLFEGNKKWSDDMKKRDPLFFEKNSKEQKPPVLWIGCSDSRVPANEVTGTLPGEIFVHRNIANMVIHTDLSMLSVLDYSVNVLGVTDVIVCGHYGCGGVNAALSSQPMGLVENWLRNIKDVYRLHQRELDFIKDIEKRAERLVELNVLEQVFNLTKTSIIQSAWNKGKKLSVHGLIYDLKTGLLTDLNATTEDRNELPRFYQVDAGMN